MNVTYAERQELNALSLKAFGSQSKWKKFIEYGFLETWTRNREAMVHGEDGKLDKKTFADKKLVTKHPTVEEIRKAMTDILEKQAAQQAVIDAANDSVDKIKGAITAITGDTTLEGVTPLEPKKYDALLAPKTYEALKAMLVNE